MVSDQGSATSASQVNAGVDNVIDSDNTNVASSLASVQNNQVSVSAENASNEQARSNSLLSLNQSSNVKPSFLAVSKVVSTGTSNNVVNGGFDQSTWGTLDVSKWTGQENNGVYELTGYTGDLEHIIVPNSADFAKAGRNVGQVGISADTTHSWFVKGSPKSIAFSKTDGQMVKAVGSDWTSAFSGRFGRNGLYRADSVSLTLFDGNSLDVSNVMNMRFMFTHDQLTDLLGVSNWKTDNVTDMSGMFDSNLISNLEPLDNWRTDNVMDMCGMFSGNQISDLAPLANWNIGNVTNMSEMFEQNQISDLTPLVNWKTDNVTDMRDMFAGNQIAYADFTKWSFPEVDYLKQFINQSTPCIIIVKNADQALFSGTSQHGSDDDMQDQVINTKQNQLHFGSDTIDMPTVYVASDKADARQKILADINTKVSEYQANHTDEMVTPTVPLDQLTKLVDLANAKFTVAKRTLPELDTNDAFALDPVNGLHEHKNVNDNGGYDTNFWGTLDVSKFTTVRNGDNLEITGYTGDASKVIIPNIADFWANGLDQGAKQVTISSSVMHNLAKNATQIGLSKTNNQKVVAGDAIWQDAFGGMTNESNTNSNANGGMWLYNPNLTVMDLHNLDTTNIINMGSMFNDGRNLIVNFKEKSYDFSFVLHIRYNFLILFVSPCCT